MEVETHLRFEVLGSAQRRGSVLGSGVGFEKPSSWLTNSEWLPGFGVASRGGGKVGPGGELAVAVGIKDWVGRVS